MPKPAKRTSRKAAQPLGGRRIRAPHHQSGPETKSVNLALQGGGAHGAYTWGVLDRLLEEERLYIDGISGTSAGAMNAAVLSMGMAQDGRAGGKAALEAFWRDIAAEGRWGPFSRLPFEKYWNGWNTEYSPGFLMYDLMSKFLSPYQLNPFNLNPLRTVLSKHVDCAVIAKHEPFKLFISATHVHSGKIKVFESKELSIEAVLASACLPTIFQTQWVNGEPYWDGGYMGNPAIFPLIYGTASRDVIIVQINPIHRAKVPESSAEIADRLNEISFNSSLMREMRAIEFVGRLVELEHLDTKRYKRMLIHMIEAEREMMDLGLASKLEADWDFLVYLRNIGRNAADKWLRLNWDSIGTRSTVDIRKEFM